LRANVLDTLRNGSNAPALPAAEAALVARIDPGLKAILLAPQAAGTTV